MEENKKTMEEEHLEEVSGGNYDEYKELRDFIKKHDPDWTVHNIFDVFRWLGKESGIAFKSMNDGSYISGGHTVFTLSDGRVIYQEELMEMLKEKYPD